MTLDVLTILFVAAIGLAVGSFLNVCIYRVPRQESIWRPGSHCPSCGRPLRWYENIPVVSYLVLRGRCRTCRSRISPVYPLIEIATAAVTVIWYLHFGPGLLLLARLLFAWALIALFAIDLQHRILPNVITIPGVVIGIAFSFIAPPGWTSALVGVLLGGGVLFIVGEAYYRVRGEEGLGMGDVKMLAMIGAFLGWQLTLVTLVLASVLGSLAGAVMLATGKGNMKYALPFGSFLTVGALVASIIGEPILRWYLSFYWH